MGGKISIERAILVGMVWVNGTALLGFGLPLAGLGAIGALMETRADDGWIVLGALILAFVLALLCSWLAWSSQITRWRLWAYRRVDDIQALKTAAVTASLIWPEGHFLEKTEFRSPDQAAELQRLERAASAGGAMKRPERRPTRLGTAGKALFFGLVLTPISVLAPMGLLSFLGIDLSGSWIFLTILAAFPLVVAGLIYGRARRDGVSADEGFRRMLPRALRAEPGDR